MSETVKPAVMRILWVRWDATDGTETREWKDIPLICEEKDCESTDFEVHNSGYSWYTTYMEINPDDPTDVHAWDGETEVGDDFECDNEWRCNLCGSYATAELAQALKEFSRLRQTTPENQLKAYMDNTIYKPVDKEKEALLEGLAGGLAHLAFNKAEDERIEAAVQRASECGHWQPPAAGVYECGNCGENEAMHVLASVEFCLVCDGNGWPAGYCTHDSDVPGK